MGDVDEETVVDGERLAPDARFVALSGSCHDDADSGSLAGARHQAWMGGRPLTASSRGCGGGPRQRGAARSTGAVVAGEKGSNPGPRNRGGQIPLVLRPEMAKAAGLSPMRPSWLRGRDLNPRPLGYEPNELPDCSTPRQQTLILARPPAAGQESAPGPSAFTSRVCPECRTYL